MSSHHIYAIYGASGLGRETLPLARSMLEGALQGGHECELVFVDDAAASSVVNGHRVLSYEEFLDADATAKYVNVAIANSAARRELFERCARDGIGPFDIRASNVCMLDSICIGPGSILSPFVTLTSNIQIGRGFHANIYSYVAHDCVIGDYVTFAPGVKCNGNIVIEDDAYIGTGAFFAGQPGDPLVIGRVRSSGWGPS